MFHFRSEPRWEFSHIPIPVKDLTELVSEIYYLYRKLQKHKKSNLIQKFGENEKYFQFQFCLVLTNKSIVALTITPIIKQFIIIATSLIIWYLICQNSHANKLTLFSYYPFHWRYTHQKLKLIKHFNIFCVS